jgi:hypothetical protein
MTQETNRNQEPYWQQKTYWPFEVIASESQTDQHRHEKRFLDAAYQGGFRPYIDGIGNLGATSNEREAWIILRGRGRWQVQLWTSDQGTLQEAVAAHLNDFDSAAEAVLLWLGGLDGAEVVERVRDHLVVSRATGRGFVLYQQPG